MKPCKICNTPQDSGYVICAECVEKYVATQEKLEQARSERRALVIKAKATAQANLDLARRLASVTAERDAAVKCITDVETYMELGSGKFAYKTVQNWRRAKEEAN